MREFLNMLGQKYKVYRGEGFTIEDFVNAVEYEIQRKGTVIISPSGSRLKESREAGEKAARDFIKEEDPWCICVDDYYYEYARRCKVSRVMILDARAFNKLVRASGYESIPKYVKRNGEKGKMIRVWEYKS